jgi:hypothetical protein
MAATYALKNSAMVVPTETARVFFAERGLVGSATDWTEEVWTLKNSFSFSVTTGDKTETLVDQTTTPVAVKYGDSTSDFAFRVPDMSKEICDIFLTPVTLVGSGNIGLAAVGTMYDTFTGYGYSLARKPVTKMVMIVFTNGSGFIFTNAEMIASPVKNAEDAFTFDIAGTILAGGGAGLENAEVIAIYPGVPTP